TVDNKVNINMPLRIYQTSSLQQKFSENLRIADLNAQIETSQFLSGIIPQLIASIDKHMMAKQGKNLIEEISESADLRDQIASENTERISINYDDPYYVVKAEKEKGITKMHRHSLIQESASIRSNKLLIKALMGIRGSIKQTSGNIIIVYKGTIIEVGQTIKGFGDWLNNDNKDTKNTVNKYTDKISKGTTLYQVLDFLGYDLKKPNNDPVHIIPTNKRHNPSLKSTKNADIDEFLIQFGIDALSEKYPRYSYVKNLLGGRVFEGDLNVILAFGTDEKAAFLSIFQRDVVEYLRKAMKEVFGINKESLVRENGIFMDFITKALESDSVKSLIDEYFEGETTSFTKKRFLDKLKASSKDESFIDRRLDEIIYKYLMSEEIHTENTDNAGLYDKFKEFYYDFDTVARKIHPARLELLTTSTGKNLFLQNLLQTFFASAISKGKPAEPLDPNKNIGEIPEARALTGFAYSELAKIYNQFGNPVFKIFDSFQFASKNTNLEDGNSLVNSLSNTKRIINGFDASNKYAPSSISHFDVISAASTSFTFGIEAKNFRYTGYLPYAIQQMGIDHLRSIDFDKNLGINNIITMPPSPAALSGYYVDRAPVRFEYSVQPIAFDDYNIYYTIFGVNQRQDMKHDSYIGDPSYKGDLGDTFNIMVAEKLNSYVKRFFPGSTDLSLIKPLIQELLKFFYSEPNDLDFLNEFGTARIYNEIREIANEIFTSSVDPRFYKETARIFAGKLDDLLIETPEGVNLVWEESLVVHLPALDGDDKSIILKPSMLPSRSTGFFIWDDIEGKKKYADELRDSHGEANGYFIMKGTPFIFVHDDDGNNGIMPVGLLGGNLPDGISLGYQIPGSVDVIKGVYICGNDGKYLLSRIGLTGLFFVRNEQWYKDPYAIQNQVINYEMEINGVIVMVPQLTYFRTSTRQTGNYIHTFLQEVVSTMVPQEYYRPLINERIALTSKLVNQIKTKKFTFMYDHKNDFSSESIFKVLQTIIHVLRSDTNVPNSIIFSLFPYLNGRFTDTSFNKFILGPNKKTVDNRIKDLGFSLGELQNLAWKNSDGTTFIGSNQYLKEWLKLIYDKIIIYDGLDPDINREKNKLTDLRDNHALDHSVLITASEREKCTPNEWNMAMEIFESASNLFGHGTIRFMLSNMVQFNKDKTIKLSISTRQDMAQVHDHIGFVATQYREGGPIKDYQKDPKFYQHLIGILILDSSIFIPRTDIIIDSRLNSYVLPFGPITLTNPDQMITANNLQSLSWNIASIIAKEYSSFITTKDIFMDFEKSQTNLYNLFSTLSDKQIITDKYFNEFNTVGKSWIETRAMNIWLSKAIKHQSRSGLFSVTTTGVEKLRYQVEDFRASYDYLRDIPFDTYNFKLKLTQSNLDNVNFQSWGKSGLSLGYISQSYQKFKDDNVKNFVTLAKKIISEFGTNGKKVLIQPISSTNDANLGYQHLMTSEHIHDNRKYLPKEPTVFEVDLDNPEEARYVLEHIANIMGTYNIAFTFREWVDIKNDPRYKDIPKRIDRMKQYFVDNTEVITTINFDGYLQNEFIHSGVSPSEQVQLTGYSTDLEGKTFFDRINDFKKWDEVWLNKFGFYATTFSKYYFNEIRYGDSRRAEYIRFVLSLLVGGKRKLDTNFM
ncbi:hypothetical protein LCGC14_1033410, partial [marine sediment metagenome]